MAGTRPQEHGGSMADENKWSLRAKKKKPLSFIERGYTLEIIYFRTLTTNQAKVKGIGKFDRSSTLSEPRSFL